MNYEQNNNILYFTKMITEYSRQLNYSSRKTGCLNEHTAENERNKLIQIKL